MPVRDNVEIGLNRFARRGYDLDEVSIVPSRRTRDHDDVSTAWQIDAFRFDIPLVTSPSDAVMSPATAVAVGRAGGLGVLNAEGLWTRYDDPTEVYRQLRAASSPESGPPTALLQQVYAEPVKPDLVAARIKEMRDAGVTAAVRVSPQHTVALAPTVLAAGVDLLVIQGTIVSAEHVTTAGHALNLKEFIADLDVPGAPRRHDRDLVEVVAAAGEPVEADLDGVACAHVSGSGSSVRRRSSGCRAGGSRRGPPT